MSIQHERVVELCNELRLGGVAAQYSALAQKAAENHTSFTDFVEELLSAERESRRARAREMFARIAGFPAIKTLDQYDFNFATGAPRKQIMEIAAVEKEIQSHNQQVESLTQPLKALKRADELFDSDQAAIAELLQTNICAAASGRYRPNSSCYLP